MNLVEPGIGIAVNAADNTEVTKNEVRGHGSYGIAMYALTDVFPPEHKLNVEPNPDNNYIHDNALADNGGNVSKRMKSTRRPRRRPVLERQGSRQRLERNDSTSRSRPSSPAGAARPAPPAADDNALDCMPSQLCRVTENAASA